MRRILLGLILLCTAILGTATASPLTFGHVVLNTAGEQPELCLRFSAPLDTHAEAHYADYLSLTPSVRPSVRATGSQLCLGGLAYGTDYTITLHAGLPAADGSRLAAEQNIPASLGDRAPLVDISGDGFILPRAVAHGLTIQTVNVSRVRIHVLRMNDKLLQMQASQNADNPLAHNELGGYQIREMMQNTAAVIWTGTMEVPQDHNRTVLTAFPLSQVIKPGMVGAYLVVAEDAAHAVPESKWQKTEDNGPYNENFYETKPTHWVIATDIALTTFTGTDGLHVSARSLADATPKAGVVIDLIANGQDVLGEATTDSTGMVRFAAGLLRGQGALAARTLTAHAAGGDFTLLDLTRPAFDFSDRGVTGRASPAPLQAYLYTERGIYRPGQNVELMALLRGRLGDAVDLPLTLVLRRPNGMEAKRFSQKAQPAAAFHQTIALSATAARGTWSVEALADPLGAPIGRVSFEVQDYVPQQLHVTLAPIAAALGEGQTLPIDVQGDFLYGAPAAGLHGQADIRITKDPSPIAAFKDWQFGLADEAVDDKTQTIDLPDADAHGHSHADAKLEMPPASIQTPLKAVVTAGLFEPSGRVVNDTQEAKLRTHAVLIGLHTRFADTRTDLNTEAGIDIRAFAADGALVAKAGLVWRLVAEDRNFDWFREGNAWHWHFHVTDREIATGTIDVGAQSPATLTRRYDWGEYRLIVADPASGATSSIRFSAGWQESADQADIPDKVHVAVDHATLAAGQSARVHIAGPFAGHASIVIANDRVIETREITVPAGGTDIEVKQTPDWGAGAYVLVSLYRPLKEASPHAPVRAVGVAWIGTDSATRILPVEIHVPGKVTPQQDVTIPVHVGNLPANTAAFLTLAAVDEGILQITRFASPDPVGFLLGKRALGVAMRDDYGKLLDGSADPGQIQGGDEGIGGAGLPVVSTRTVALFNGPVTLDSAGNANIVLKIPDFEGQLRLMAVAYTAHRIGQAQATLIVRDPVVAEIAVPRFLATGDDAKLAVTLNDTDGPAGAYSFKIGVSGAARLQTPAPITARLAPGKHVAGSIDVLATDEGVATIDAELSGPNHLTVHRSWQIAVRAAHAPVTLEQSAWQEKDQKFAIDASLLAPFVPGSVHVSLGYSAFGGIDVPSLLQSLERYPYGCTEQLTSTAFPLVYYNDPALLGSLPHDQGIHDRVQTAIDTILDRQDESGEFGLWHVGDRDASTWLSVYALDFLTHAKEAGFDVPDAALQRASTFLHHAADNTLEERPYRNYAQGALSTQAYGTYVLARLGRADLGDLRRLHDSFHPKLVDAALLWLGGENTIVQPLALGQMAGTFALMGDRSRADDAFRMARENIGVRVWPAWWFDWSYSSRLSDTAGLLSIAAETGSTELTRQLLQDFSTIKTDPTLLDTREQAALLSAAHALNKNATPLTFSVNGATVSTGNTPSFSPAIAQMSAGYSVQNLAAHSLWRTLSITGSPREAAPALSAGYSIDKTFTDLKGAPIDAAHLRQNDRIVVALHGFLTGDDASHRTVIVDMLPAGWEIESPVTTETQFAFLGALSNTRVKEARDDRFVAALDFGADLLGWFRAEEDESDGNATKPRLDRREFRVAYVARAITPGHFTLPEAVVQDMYRPGFMARTAAGRTDVETH
jgi:uncharacterized protein YfaS (alpha-2-macroglobulin family)